MQSPRKNYRQYILDSMSSDDGSSRTQPMVLAKYPIMAARMFAKSMGPGIWHLSIRIVPPSNGQVSKALAVVRTYRVKIDQSGKILKVDKIPICTPRPLSKRNPLYLKKSARLVTLSPKRFRK